MKLRKWHTNGLKMKRTCNLYENVIDFDRLLETYELIKCNCRNKTKVLQFAKSLNTNLMEILFKLKAENYAFSKYNIFLIRKPKYRIIMSENIADKIVNHLVSNLILIPGLESCLIDTNVATRINKGTEYAFNYLCKCLKNLKDQKDIHVLKIDISKYFYNIDHEILLSKIKKKIKDKRAITIISNILKTTNEEYVNIKIAELIAKEKEYLKKSKISMKSKLENFKILDKIPLYNFNKGLPIGNMTSQIMAIFYLNDVDHFIKENLKFKNYIRYMDDLIIIDSDYLKLKESFLLIQKEILKEKLITNNKSRIINIKKEKFNFLGYTFSYKNHKLDIKYNNKTLKLINQKLKLLENSDFNKYLKSKASYKGYFQKCKSKLFIDKYKVLEVNSLYDKYLEIKKKYPEHIVLLKSGRFYKTFDTDAVIINYLLNYNVIDNKIGFPIESLFKVKNILKRNNVNYIIFEDNDLTVIDNENSNTYLKIANKAEYNYDVKLRNDEILTEVKKKLISDESFYDDLSKFIYQKQ